MNYLYVLSIDHLPLILWLKVLDKEKMEQSS